MKRAATADEVIYSLQVALEKGSRNTSRISDLVRHVLEDRQWGEFHSFTGVPRTHESFREFVIAPRYEGLGTTRDGLLAIIRLEDEELAVAVEKAWREDVTPVAKHGTNQHTREEDKGNPTPNNRTADGILRSLKRDHPDLAQEVIDGNTTATAAARKVGYRTPVIRLGKVETVARKLRDHYTPEEVRKLANLLTEEG